VQAWNYILQLWFILKRKIEQSLSIIPTLSTERTITSLLKSLNMKRPRHMTWESSSLLRTSTKLRRVKLINVIIILPTYNSISITGYNENRVFSYFLLQSAVFCTSLFVPLPVFFWQLCLSSVYGFFNNTFSNFKRFLHLHFELSGRKISKYNSNVVV
jgi:hypothetical protein